MWQLCSINSDNNRYQLLLMNICKTLRKTTFQILYNWFNAHPSSQNKSKLILTNKLSAFTELNWLMTTFENFEFGNHQFKGCQCQYWQFCFSSFYSRQNADQLPFQPCGKSNLFLTLLILLILLPWWFSSLLLSSII